MKLGWVASAVLVLAACGTTQAVSSRSASPAVDDYGPAPAGVALVYVPDPRHDGWYVGVDWTGKPRATMKLSPPLTPVQTLLQAPDGSAFVIPAFKATGSAFLDRLGKPIPDADDRQERVMWGDDSTHVCALDWSLERQWQLGLKTPGRAAVTHPVALDPLIVQSGIIAVDFQSCSPENDRAVLVYNYFGRPTDLYVVRISDGAVLLHQSHPANVLAGITASEDSALIAENSSKSIGYLMGPTAPNTTVRRVADGSIVAKLDPGYFVVAFSHDDSLALVSTTPLAAGAPTDLALVRLSDGKVLWQRNSSREFGGSWVRPDGADVAYQLGTSAGPGMGPIELVIVHPDGTSASFHLP